MPVARGQAKRPFVLNDIPAFTALLLHQKCGRATPRGEAQWICRYERAPLTIAKIANRITPACPYIFPSARRRSGMVARQVRRSVVMSNLQIRLLPMDSDRTPLEKGKDVLHGAARAAPLRQSVEQPWQDGEAIRTALGDGITTTLKRILIRMYLPKLGHIEII